MLACRRVSERGRGGDSDKGEEPKLRVARCNFYYFFSSAAIVFLVAMAAVAIQLISLIRSTYLFFLEICALYY
jgi:hypothetical protein